MSRRQDLADAIRARDIRRVQEQAAHQALQRQQRVLADARLALDRRIDVHAENQAEWAAVLDRTTVDPGVLGLWRMTTEISRDEVTAAERTVTNEDETAAACHRSWAARLQAADAVEAVSRAAARQVRRAAEEQALLSAEDAVRFRRPRW